MKILHLLSEKSWRGGEQQAAILIEQCQLREIDTLVACRKGSAFEKYCIEHVIPYISLNFKGQFDLSTIWILRNICRENSVDLIHIHSANAHGIAVLAYMLGSKTPIILSRRVMYPIKNKWFSKFKYNHIAISKILCVSDAVKKVLALNIKDTSKLHTVYDAVDPSIKQCNAITNLKQDYNIPTDHKLIVNIAAYEPDKDPYTFIDAASMLLQNGMEASFFLIGDGSLKAELQNYIKQQDLEQNIFVTGFINNIPAVLKSVDCLVVTSKSEGLGTILLEAISCQTAIVASNTGGIPEIVKHEKTGLLFPVGQSKALASTIIRSLSEGHSFIAAADKHLEQHFTANIMASNSIFQYQKALT